MAVAILGLAAVVVVVALVVGRASRSSQRRSRPTRPEITKRGTEVTPNPQGVKPLPSSLPDGQLHIPGAADPNAPEELLTPSEVASLFKVDPKTVSRWAEAGKLNAVRTLGGHRRFRRSEIERLLAEGNGLTTSM